MSLKAASFLYPKALTVSRTARFGSAVNPTQDSAKVTEEVLLQESLLNPAVESKKGSFALVASMVTLLSALMAYHAGSVVRYQPSNEVSVLNTTPQTVGKKAQLELQTGHLIVKKPQTLLSIYPTPETPVNTIGEGKIVSKDQKVYTYDYTLDFRIRDAKTLETVLSKLRQEVRPTVSKQGTNRAYCSRLVQGLADLYLIDCLSHTPPEQLQQMLKVPLKELETYLLETHTLSKQPSPTQLKALLGEGGEDISLDKQSLKSFLSKNLGVEATRLNLTRFDVTQLPPPKAPAKPSGFQLFLERWSNKKPH